METFPPDGRGLITLAALSAVLWPTSADMAPGRGLAARFDPQETFAPIFGCKRQRHNRCPVAAYSAYDL
jgi:hypothetical protein